jgi:hypothetical protein
LALLSGRLNSLEMYPKNIKTWNIRVFLGTFYRYQYYTKQSIVSDGERVSPLSNKVQIGLSFVYLNKGLLGHGRN